MVGYSRWVRQVLLMAGRSTSSIDVVAYGLVGSWFAWSELNVMLDVWKAYLSGDAGILPTEHGASKRSTSFFETYSCQIPAMCSARRAANKNLPKP